MISPSCRIFIKKRLWHLPGPRTWITLLWRILTNSLAIGKEFEKRNLEVYCLCHLCDREEVESLEHLFRDCPFASRLWRGTQLGIRSRQTQMISIQDWIVNWISYLLTLSDPKVLIISFLCVIWTLWCARNNVALGDNSISLVGCICIYEETLSRVILANCNLSKSLISLPSQDDLDSALLNLRLGNRCKLIGIDYNCVQTNIFVDAAWREDNNTGLGWFIKFADSSSYSCSKNRIFCISPGQAEASAIFEALKWVLKEKILHVTIFSDCLQVLMQIMDSSKRYLNTRVVIADILNLCCLFHCISFCFIPRKFNSMAHKLAQRAIIM
ncbi:uncharacterized protein LOC141632916 [Silene latifolia]|uniref:uncharacterized protein LOC141632916 n=1 Tax=Silene latifolia TaxID=37657 RepID=UPI003D780361